MLVAGNRPPSVVVQQVEIGSPVEREWKPGVEANAQGTLETFRPTFQWAELRLGPVAGAHEFSHLAFAGKYLGSKGRSVPVVILVFHWTILVRVRTST